MVSQLLRLTAINDNFRPAPERQNETCSLKLYCVSQPWFSPLRDGSEASGMTPRRLRQFLSQSKLLKKLRNRYKTCAQSPENRSDTYKCRTYEHKLGKRAEARNATCARV